MLEDWDLGKCNVLALGIEDTSMDKAFLEDICERGLVYTSSVIAEIPIGKEKDAVRLVDSWFHSHCHSLFMTRSISNKIGFGIRV